MEPFYTPSFARHLNSLARSSYFTRSLDADDCRFLEYVRRTGSANGNLPATNTVLLEELEFWHLPYSIAPGLERRVGRRPRPEETPEQREMRKARANAWHARRIIRENERAMAEAELVRERREWEAAQRQRKQRELINDQEWEAFAPRKAKFGATVGRHHIPQWKLDEIRDVSIAKKKRKVERASGERLAKSERKARKAADAAHEDALQARARAREEKRIREQVAREVQHAAEVELAIARDQERRAAIIAEARKTVERANRLQQEHTEHDGVQRYSADTLKRAIMVLLNSTPGQHWTQNTMMHALGGCTREFLDQCLNELIRDGRLRKVEAVK